MRGEGTSDDYFSQEVPALPSFKLHYVSEILFERDLEYRTGVIYTTNRESGNMMKPSKNTFAISVYLVWTWSTGDIPRPSARE